MFRLIGGCVGVPLKKPYAVPEQYFKLFCKLRVLGYVVQQDVFRRARNTYAYPA